MLLHIKVIYINLLLKRKLNKFVSVESLVEVLDGHVHESRCVYPNRQNIGWVCSDIDSKTKFDVLPVEAVDLSGLDEFPQGLQRCKRLV